MVIYSHLSLPYALLAGRLNLPSQHTLAKYLEYRWFDWNLNQIFWYLLQGGQKRHRTFSFRIFVNRKDKSNTTFNLNSNRTACSFSHELLNYVSQNVIQFNFLTLLYACIPKTNEKNLIEFSWLNFNF